MGGIDNAQLVSIDGEQWIWWCYSDYASREHFFLKPNGEWRTLDDLEWHTKVNKHSYTETTYSILADAIMAYAERQRPRHVGRAGFDRALRSVVGREGMQRFPDKAIVDGVITALSRYASYPGLNR